MYYFQYLVNFCYNNISDNSVVFFSTYIYTLKENYVKDFINYKNEEYFFYWTNIHLMRYNRKRKYFFDNEQTV